MSTTPSVDKALAYATQVVAGDVVACKWVRLACQRHLDDLRKSKKRGSKFAFIFDHQEAERACKFIQALPHTKGKWAAHKQLMQLEPWQCFLVCSVFGWKHKATGLRRFRKVLLFVARKNGKSALAAAIGLFMLVADREHGAEVYSGATTEKQAHEVFRPARLMAERTPELVDWFGMEVRAGSILVPDIGSRFEPIIGKPGDGSSPHCAIIDEYHEHKTDELLDTMITGMGAREQPLALIITTAGDNLAGPCYALQQDAQRMLEGVVQDDELFAMIYTIDAGDDWTSETAMRKANPNYGISVLPEFLAARLADAKNNSRKQSTYQTKHLNVWVGARNAFFNVERWRECGDPSLELSEFHGQRAFIGLDLASKVDIAALEVLIPQGDGDYVRFGRYYLPETAVTSGVNEHYAGWMRDGKMIITDGEIIDFHRIRDDILELCGQFEVAEVAYDPFQATMLVTELMGHGVPVVEMAQKLANFSEPMKTLDALIRARRIRHDGDPVMLWMISNVTARVDAKENVFPRKERPENKIDGVMALLMALGRSMVAGDQDISAAIDDFISVKL